MQAIDADRLRGIVRRALGSDDKVELDDWTCTQISYNELNPVSGGLYRVQGVAADCPWSVILKILRHPRGGVLPIGDPVPHGWGEERSHYNYWLREFEAFESRALEHLPSGLRAPKAFGIAVRSPSERELWLEDVEHDAHPWSLEVYESVARNLGRFNGAYAAGEPIPSGAWVSTNFLRGWTKEFGRAVAALRAGVFANNPVLAGFFPNDVSGRLMQLCDRFEALFSALDRLPQCFAHHDAFPSNVLVSSQTPGADPVAVDWAFAGRAAVGEEVVQLIAPTMQLLGMPVSEGRRLEAAALTAYTAGLEDAGAAVDPREVRFAYTAASALRWGLAPFFFLLTCTEDDEMKVRVQEMHGRSFEASVAHLVELQDHVLNLADEAYRSSDTID